MVQKKDPLSFLFSVNFHKKDPILHPNAIAIQVLDDKLIFGDNEIVIFDNSNNNEKSFCKAKGLSFKLKTAHDGG